MVSLGPHACVAPVNSPAEVLADPHLRSRPLTVEVELDGRRVRQLSPRLAVPDPPELGRQPIGRTSAPEADELLRGFGVADEEIAELRGIGVIG
jgi:crotonobetainyl-CoA:carnitine CoA-transferase CaiB-like acyl-CoA transferase